MTVNTVAPIERRPWRGFDNPALPSGIWVGHVVSTGDGSGGDHIVSLVFRALASPLSGQIYSVEQFTMTCGATVNIEAQMFASGFDFLQAPHRVHGPRAWTCQLVPNPIACDVRFLQTQMRSILLGQASHFGTATSNIGGIIPNVNAEGFSFSGGGYIWSPESALAEGGPQKPVGALW